MAAPETTRARIYFPGPPADAERNAARHELSDAVRGLIDDLLFLDTGTEDLRQLRDAIGAVRRRVAALPSLRDQPRSGWPVDDFSLAERGPYAGRANPVAPPLHFESLTPRTRAWAVYGPAYEGSAGDMHGGVVIGAFDDVLGCAQMAGPVTGRTGTMTVRLRTLSPIGKRIDYEGWIERVEGRKVFLRGTAHCGDTLLAEAEAIFVAPRSPPPQPAPPIAR